MKTVTCGIMVSCYPFVSIYFFTIINYILTLGSFDDFKALHNLLLPFLIGLFSLFILQPTYKHSRKKLNHNNEEDDNNNDNRKEEGTLCDVHIDVQSNDDAHNETSM